MLKKIAILEKLLNEMSFNRKNALMKIRYEIDSIIEHLIKMILFGTKSKWEKEIITKILRIQRIKIKPSKLFSKKTYFDILFVEPLDDNEEDYKDTIIYNLVISMLSEYNKMHSKYRGLITKEITITWKNKLKKLMSELAINLENNKLNNQETILNIIKRNLL